MGTKRMGSQDVSGSRGVNGAMPVCVGGSGAGILQDPKLQTLVRQGPSLYNLTLDEVQHQLGDLGKQISSMNIDELLKSVWSVEANQGGMGSFDYTAGSASAPTLARDLSKKTVDEVWQVIQQEQRNIGLDLMNDRQLTLGEMTLEDFLVKAGVCAEASGKLDPDASLGIETMQDMQEQPQWMSYEVPPIHDQQTMLSVFMPGQPSQQTTPISLVATPMVDVSYPDGQMGALSDTPTPGRKRGGASSDVVVERTVERRQKRMIKNRESAARSRARKQAYTHELENKVLQLEQENERLRRQQAMEKVLPRVPIPEPKHQLRRTSSARF